MTYPLDQIAWFLIDHEKYELNLIEAELASMQKTYKLLRQAELGYPVDKQLLTESKQ